MKTKVFMRTVLSLTAAAVVGSAAASELTGAGATFPYPIYAKWADAYKKSTDTGLNYQSIGSGGGIKQIKAKTVDFGASDAPLEADDLEKSGLTQFPAIMGGVVPVYNIKDIDAGKIKFSGELLADIYLGKVKKWNDPAIAKLNHDVKLPSQDISVVHRSDGSGTTFLWTNYLAQVSGEWKSNVGADKAVRWPVGVGGKGNEGVASYVKQINGSIGYVEYAYAKQSKLTYGMLQNHDGKFIAPNNESFMAAATGADWAGTPGMGVILTNQAGANAWPITGASFILMYKSPEKADSAREVLKFFDWAFQNGRTMALDLDYVPLPEPVVKQVQAAWKKNIKDSSGKAVYK